MMTNGDIVILSDVGDSIVVGFRFSYQNKNAPILLDIGAGRIYRYGGYSCDV